MTISGYPDIDPAVWWLVAGSIVSGWLAVGVYWLLVKIDQWRGR